MTFSHATKPVSPLLPVKVITIVKHGPFLRVFMREVMSDTKSKARMGTVLTWGHSYLTRQLIKNEPR